MSSSQGLVICHACTAPSLRTGVGDSQRVFSASQGHPDVERAKLYDGHRVRPLLLVLLPMAVAALGGCPSAPSGSKPTADAQAPQCTRVGQTCEYAPNKLGSCVQRDNCTTDCLVCQSQH